MTPKAFWTTPHDPDAGAGLSDEPPRLLAPKIGLYPGTQKYSHIRLSRLEAVTAASAIRIAKIISLIMMPKM